MNKGIWSWLSPLLVLLALVFGVSLIAYFGRQNNSAVKRDGKESICEVYDESERMIKVRYEVDGKTYDWFTGKGYSNILDGEEFKMKYLPEDPESIVVYFSKPYLSEEYVWLETSCTSMRKKLSVIDFWYTVDNKEFRRKTLYNDHAMNPSNYIVKYRKSDPRVGYLFPKE